MPGDRGTGRPTGRRRRRSTGTAARAEEVVVVVRDDVAGDEERLAEGEQVPGEPCLRLPHPDGDHDRDRRGDRDDVEEPIPGADPGRRGTRPSRGRRRRYTRARPSASQVRYRAPGGRTLGGVGPAQAPFRTGAPAAGSPRPRTGAAAREQRLLESGAARRGPRSSSPRPWRGHRSVRCRACPGGTGTPGSRCPPSTPAPTSVVRAPKTRRHRAGEGEGHGHEARSR